MDGEPITDQHIRREDRAITTRTQRIWLRDDGIIVAMGLPGADQNRADAEHGISVIRMLAGQTRRPLLGDMRLIKGVDRGARACYASAEPESSLSAMAVLVGSPLTRMIGGFVVGLYGVPVVPTRMFTSEPEAIAWLLGFVR